LEKSAVLVNLNEDEQVKNVTIVNGAEIDEIKVISTQRTSTHSEFNMDEYFNSNKSENPTVDITKRRDTLIEWLKHNHLPVKLVNDQVISILDCVFINSPYSVDNCESINEIILDKVRQLVAKIDNNNKLL
jgi:hypothetical protein